MVQFPQCHQPKQKKVKVKITKTNCNQQLMQLSIATAFHSREYPCRHNATIYHLWPRATIGGLTLGISSVCTKHYNTISNEACDYSNSELLKHSFNLQYESSSSSNVFWLHSFQIHYYKKIGATRQTIFLFLSRPLNFHVRRKFLIEIGKNRFKPKTSNKKTRNACVFL